MVRRLPTYGNNTKRSNRGHSYIQRHRVVIPSLKNYVGAYRFVPYDDTLAIISRRLGYFRCPNIITAVSLPLWLRHPRIKLVGELNDMSIEYS